MALTTPSNGLLKFLSAETGAFFTDVRIFRYMGAFALGTIIMNMVFSVEYSDAVRTGIVTALATIIVDFVLDAILDEQAERPRVNNVTLEKDT